MPADSEKRQKFYVGPKSDRKRGVAGKTFVDRKLYVVHMREETPGKWVADDPDYIVHDSKRHHPPYKAFATVPIMVGADEEPLGVLSFDSANPCIFDSPRVQDVLQRVAQRVAAAMLIEKALAERRSANVTNGTVARKAIP
jgi:GAF domain-containing protein